MTCKKEKEKKSNVYFDVHFKLIACELRSVPAIEITPPHILNIPPPKYTLKHCVNIAKIVRSDFFFFFVCFC